MKLLSFRIFGYTALVLGLWACLLALPAFAQDAKDAKNKQNKNKKEKELMLTNFSPTDTFTILKPAQIQFEYINKRAYYYNSAELSKIQRLKENKDWKDLYPILYDYVSNFGIDNFKKDMPLVWLLARTSEYLDNLPLAKELYKIIIKHNRGEFGGALKHYDSLIKFEKELYADLEYYYKFVERRRQIDTLFPPKDVLLNMGESVNSKYEDYGLTIAGNDSVIYFTSKRITDFSKVDLINLKLNEDIYYSTKDAFGLWTNALPFKEINSPINEGSPCLSVDGSMFVFSRCNTEERIDPEVCGNCDLYITYLTDSGWTKPSNLGKEVNSYSWDSHPSFSVTGDTLFYASDRKGGFGGVDIYYSVRDENGKWGKSLNLGPIINTQMNEVSPFLHPVHNLLYFSSDGQLLNFGDFDIFKTYSLNGKWTEPKNIGPLVNGEGSEFYFTIDARSTKLFYAKSHSKTDANLDLNSFPLPMEAQPNAVVRFSGKVVEPTTGEIFKGVVTVLDMDDGIEIAPKKIAEDGSFFFDLINKKNYMLIIEGDNFFKIEESFFLDGEKKVELTPTKVKPNTVVCFKSIDFETGSAKLKPSMENNLHLVIDFLSTNPSYQLRIEGHTDSDGNPESNLKLSQERADVIRSYIISYGQLKPDRVFAIGYGSAKPVVKETTAEDKKVNRRVEFKFYQNGQLINDTTQQKITLDDNNQPIDKKQ